MNVWQFTAAITACFAAVAVAGDNDPLTFTAQRENTQAKITLRDDVAIIDITSPFGIDRAAATHGCVA